MACTLEIQDENVALRKVPAGERILSRCSGASSDVGQEPAQIAGDRLGGQYSLLGDAGAGIDLERRAGRMSAQLMASNIPRRSPEGWPTRPRASEITPTGTVAAHGIAWSEVIADCRPSGSASCGFFLSSLDHGADTLT